MTAVAFVKLSVRLTFPGIAKNAYDRSSLTQELACVCSVLPLHAIDLASSAWSVARSRRQARSLRSDLERATQEIALLKEELALKDARWSRLWPGRRPHFAPVEHMRILQLKAARPWWSG
jgi:hypothetical protein